MATETKGPTPGPCKARHKVGPGWEILVPCGEQDFVEGVTKNEYPMFVEAFVKFPTPDWAQQVEAYAHLFAAAPETAAERDRLREVNAELLEALQNLTGCFSTNMLDQNNSRGIWMAGLAIIRKTTEGG